MSAPLRIATVPGLHRYAAEDPDPWKGYLARLVKLIPAEILALYQAGKLAIGGGLGAGAPAASTVLSPAVAWIGWTGFCLVALVVVRRWATSDRAAQVPAEWRAILVSGISFLVWVYSQGDVFAHVLHAWDPLLAALLLLGWTFVTPWIYAPDRGGPDS